MLSDKRRSEGEEEGKGLARGTGGGGGWGSGGCVSVMKVRDIHNLTCVSRALCTSINSFRLLINRRRKNLILFNEE